MILAINTPKIAARKENVAYTVRSANRWLLTPVNAYRSDVHTRAGAAVTSRSSEPVSPAFPGTNRAFRQKLNFLPSVKTIIHFYRIESVSEDNQFSCYTVFPGNLPREITRFLRSIHDIGEINITLML
jgi:hypothetical protein